MNRRLRVSSLIMMALFFCLFITAEPAAAQMTYTVTNTNDVGSGSLRQAILDANAHANVDASTPDLIYFNISGTGPFTISPASALPTITDPVIIDGLTQPGASCSSWPPTLLIELNGTSAGSAVNGLTITAGNSTVRGLVINRFIGNANSDGIEISANGSNVIECNLIGTNVAGTTDLGNLGNGVLVSNAPGNTFGGTASGTRNLFSGNNAVGIRISGSASTGNLVQGNYIGTNAAGTAALGNSAGGVAIVSSASNNTIGGTTSGAGNVISGNTGGSGVDGIEVEQSSGNFIQGNYIGTDVTGTLDLGNGGNGVLIDRSSTTTIGGTSAAVRNVISGNNTAGVRIEGSGASGNLVQGNYIGTNAAGTAALANSTGGVAISSSATNNTVGGTASGAGNVISGNSGTGADGVEIELTSGNSIQGNYIGTDVTGTVDLGNAENGILIDRSSNVTIGGTSSAARNVISGNNISGVKIEGSGATGNLVQGNYIGTQADGVSGLGNTQHGIYLTASGSTSNTIGGATSGAANTIAFNGFDGVFIDVGTGQAVRSNSIHSNGGLGINLGTDGVTANDAGDGDTGPNNRQNFPVVSAANVTPTQVTINGSLNSAASTSFTVEFFSNTACDASNNGEGQTFIGSATVMTDGTGNVNFSQTFSVVVASGSFITSTATDPSGNTSEFSQCAQATSPPATATVSGDAIICAGSSTTIQAALTGTAPWNLTWSDGHVQNGVTTSPATRNVSPSTTTVYTITSFSDANGPGTASGSATITVNAVPTANAGADLATASGVSAKIGANPTASGTGPFTYNWSPAAELSSTTVANPTATPSSTTTYEVTVEDANGCIATDQVTVRAGNLVNSRIKAIIGPTNLYDPVLNQVRADIAIRNISAAPIYGPLTAVFKTLTPGPPTITIPNADGGGEGLGCYYDYSMLLGPDEILSPGETSGYKLWIFQEHVTPPVSFRFFADVIGDLDGIPKTAADDQPLALAFDLQNGAVQDYSASMLTDNVAEIPKTYALHQNHPNPFNPSTTMQFDLPEAVEVTLKIYNSVGQLVRTLVSGHHKAGAHNVIWDARNDGGVQMASGVYLAVFKAGDFQQVRRVLLMK